MSTIRPRKPAVSPGGAAGGDLFGEYPNPEVYGLEGYPLEDPPPSNGDTITFNTALQMWQHSPPVSTGGDPIGPAGGDLSGSYPNPTVAELLGRPMLNSAPSTGNSLVWNGTQWAPATPGATGSAGGDLTGSYPNPTLAAVGSAATYGSASQVAVVTTDSKGRVSSASNTSIQITETQVTNLTTHLGDKADKTTTVSAGTGLSGGGDLSANRTISMPNVGTAATYGSSTVIPVITTDAQGRVSGVTATALSTSLSSAAFPRMGNVIIVDQINGNDSTGVINGLSFQTINAAITYLNVIIASPGIPAGGVTIWVMPGVYSLSAGITIPDTCSIRGISTQTTTIRLTTSVTATLLTMGENTRIEDITLSLISTNDTANLVGVSLPGATMATSKIRGCVLTVNNSTVSVGSTTTVTGILSSGTSSLLPNSFVSTLSRAFTINIISNGSGNKRGVFVNAANILAMRDTQIYVAIPSNVASTGSYVGAETTNNLAKISLLACSVYGPSSVALAYSGSDILQTLPVERDSYGINIGPGTDLINRNAGDLPFELTTTSAIVPFAIKALLLSPGATGRWLWPGTLATGGDTTPVFFRFDRKIIVQGISVNMRVAPGLGNNVVFTLYKSTLGTLATATATAMTVTISDTNTAAVNLNSSVAIKAGEYIAIRADRSASGAEDIFVQVDFY